MDAKRTKNNEELNRHYKKVKSFQDLNGETLKSDKLKDATTPQPKDYDEIEY